MAASHATHPMTAAGPPRPARRTVVTVEQALSMPYATSRFVHLGWRVIRVEPTPVEGRPSKGDPNRHIGRPVAGDDRHSYFIAPNVGKEAISIDLKQPAGRALLRRLVCELPADVFCCNTLPARHRSLGIDFETLSTDRPELIWCSISAMGLAHPDVPGYDPMMQALCGYMDLTGEPGGPPLQCGLPLTDLKAGDEAFAQVLHALLERTERQGGCCVDISMAHAAVSWLLTFLPMLDMGSTASELRRAGNEHRQFIPVNAYPTRDGFLYLAVGSDAQWQRLVATPMFASLGQPPLGPELASNEGRRAHKAALHEAIAAITGAHAAATVTEALVKAGIPTSPITAIEQVMELPFVRASRLRTRAPDGRTVRLPPPAVATGTLRACHRELPFAPAYGQHTEAVLAEIGLSPERIAALRAQGVVA